MNSWLKILAILFILFNLYLGSWPMQNQDIYFDTDIARDFLIMDEISQKKVVLIGPRADADGLFHGPLWHYLNYPAFALSNGNPVAVGWYWVLLTAVFVLVSFWIAKKLFDEKTAWLYALFLSLYMIYYIRGYSHPFAVLFLMPLLFYFFVNYRKTKSFKNLVIVLGISGLMTHLEIGAGAPFLVLTSVYILYQTVKEKKFSHLLGFFVLAIPFANFILFDLRHEFIQIRSAITYILGQRKAKPLGFIDLIGERLKLVFIQGLNFFKNEATYWNIIPSYIFAYFLFVYTKLKRDKYRSIYSSFLILYVGFYLISILHRAQVLPFYWLPLTPLVFMIFFSMMRDENKKVFYPLVALIFAFNFLYNIDFVKGYGKFAGLNHGSWKFHNELSRRVFEDAPSTFGYFIYAPDFYGYAEKYALRYNQKNSLKKVTPFQKQKTTYLVIEPPPSDRPGLSIEWWRKNKLKISGKPVRVFDYPRGFRIEKYILTDKELAVPPDPDTTYWMYFR